jgi:hypothetical protein
VIVGTAPNQLEITFYYDLIATRSRLFREGERSTEEESTPVVLQDHNPSTFDLYLEYLYDNAVPKRSRPKVIRELEKKLYPPGLTEEEKEQYYTGNAKFHSARCKELVDLYILADHLMDPVTANMAVDELRTFFGKYSSSTSTELIGHVMRSTKKGDGLRTLFADFFVYQFPPIDPELPKEFSVLIAERYAWKKDALHIDVCEAKASDFEYMVGMVYRDDLEYYQDFEEEEQFLAEYAHSSSSSSSLSSA